MPRPLLGHGTERAGHRFGPLRVAVDDDQPAHLRRRGELPGGAAPDGADTADDDASGLRR